MKATVNVDVVTMITGVEMNKDTEIEVVPEFHGLYKIISPAEYEGEYITPDLLTFLEVSHG